MTAATTTPYTRVVAEGKRQLTEGSEGRFWSGVADAGRFFMGEADVQRALLKLARLLDDARIPYAILGAMALNEYGYRRLTIDVDVLLTAEGLEASHLPVEFAEHLDPSVRQKYQELWEAAQTAEPE